MSSVSDLLNQEFIRSIPCDVRYSLFDEAFVYSQARSPVAHKISHIVGVVPATSYLHVDYTAIQYITFDLLCSRLSFLVLPLLAFYRSAGLSSHPNLDRRKLQPTSSPFAVD